MTCSFRKKKSISSCPLHTGKKKIGSAMKQDKVVFVFPDESPA